MSIIRPYAFNTGSTISGTTQIGDIAIGESAQDYSANPGGVQWWMGPDEEISGYTITVPVVEQNQPTPIGNIGSVRFRRTNEFTTDSFISIANMIARRQGYSPLFDNATDALNWLSLTGYPTTFAFEDETISFLARMDVQPSYKLKDLINITIKDLKSYGIWNKLDVLTMYGVHTAQAALLNWKGNICNQTNVNSTTFIPKMGFRNEDGAARYLNSNFIASTHGVNYTLNNAMYGVYTKDYNDNAIRYPIGVYSSLYSSRFYGNLDTKGSLSGSVNYTNNTPTIGVCDYGMLLLERVSSSNIRYALNGVPSSLKSQAVNALPTKSMFIITHSTNGTPTGIYSLSGFQSSFMGCDLSDNEHINFYNTLKYFIDNVDSTF